MESKKQVSEKVDRYMRCVMTKGFTFFTVKEAAQRQKYRKTKMHDKTSPIKESRLYHYVILTPLNSSVIARLMWFVEEDVNRS